ncbi:hypothetical protein G7N32_19375 [Escherichia coli]|nr:hypothetical protein [Escherichia coli]
MKRKYFPASVKWGWLVLSAALVAPTIAHADFKTAMDAKNCQPQANNCPYPADLMKTDPKFKKSIETAMSWNGLVGLLGQEGALNGPQGPLEPLKIDGKDYLKGSMCADGDCGDHNLIFLYELDHGNFIGFYTNRNDGQWVNTPSDGEAKVLRSLVKGEVTPAQNSTTASATPAPTAAPAKAAPKTIWEVTGDDGRTLGDVCGGNKQTCTVVGSTKHIVAIWNHQSLNGCAFGDIYMVDKDELFWKQYDTGTCSPNAWIRKGSMNNGQYWTVDVGVGSEVVMQYPVEYWSLVRDFTGKDRPSWEKAKQAAKQ